MTKWRDDVVAALRGIGGKGTLSEIYEAVRKLRQKKLPTSWEAIVRRELEHNSSDSESFKGRQDLFKSDGIGTGVWSLRDATDSPWTAAEVAALVSDYFAMLGKELRGQDYNKTAHRTQLLQSISRKPGAIERKHQNVSSILRKLGYPWIQGYKPLKNIQGALAQEVLLQLQNDDPRPEDFTLAPKVKKQTLAGVFVDRPVGRKRAHGRRNTEAVARTIDFAEIDTRNRALGRAGEEFVVNVERARLRDLGLTTQAKLVKWVARDEGDGLGYDIISYDENGNEIFIEVKTTRGNSLTPFYLSEAERVAAIRKGDMYRLYRVFRFGHEPLIYVIPGPLDAEVVLEPTVYRVSLIDANFDAEMPAIPGK